MTRLGAARWDGPVAYADGCPLLTVDPGDRVPGRSSPRPFAHPVRTLGGTVVTDVAPRDHRHHLGVSMAVPDLAGTNHWGGRTHVRGAGSTLLPNHGRQRTTDVAIDGATRRERVEWCDEHARLQAVEDRALTASPAPGDRGWVLEWRSVVEPVRELSIGSPATNGREGAFYGGWFWRTGFDGARTTVRVGTGSADRRTGGAHGSASPWLLVASTSAHLLAVQHGVPRPWFVRSSGYVGFGPALAVGERLRIAPAAPLVQDVSVLVGDGPAPRGEELEQLAARLVEGGNVR
ncbi:DUF6807 family protein [Kineococcus sp. SYSU DK003]|uniref:DUF6807 family protein n=1 Tax=Kineococcus sp. SYSU DK003 TaxID=3383124 RepID=UPI003D7C5CC0